MNKIEVVGLGALNMDNLCKVTRILDNGEAVVGEAASFPGGSAANTIYGLAKLGVSTGFIGTVGGDDDGEELKQDFVKMGVDVSQIKVKAGAKTGSVLCLSDKLGQRSLYVMPGANSLLTTNDLDSTYINQAGMLHLSSFADDRQFQILLQLMDKLDSKVRLSFSPGALYTVKGLKALAPILRRTYILFLNQNELHELTGKEIRVGAESCLREGCQKVAVTLGKGAKLGQKTTIAISYIKEAGSEYIVEPSSQDIVALDTTGAGDAFACGFLFGLLKGKGLKECGRLGDVLAQFCITKMGARQGLPTASELTKRYQELYSEEL